MDNDDVLKIVWVVVAVLVSASEIFVPGFFLLPFGLGAGAAAVAAFAGASFTVQLVVFVVASAAFFAGLRPLARRLNRLDEPEGVGANRLVNQRGVVTDSIGPNDPGLVRLDREDWRADSLEGSTLAVGTPVRVVEVRGTRVMVVADSQDPIDDGGSHP
jgi:membrane protein implicated in regulation of membrane protease activity